MDGSEMRSEKVPLSLMARGVDLKALQGLQWQPTDISFTDSETGEHKQFALYSYTCEDPDGAKFLLNYEVKP
jgi:hypothetical protein